MNIAWLLSNVLQGWAHPDMLDAYEAERQPITEQVSRLAMQSMVDTMDALGKGSPPPSMSSRYNPAGIAIRKAMGMKLHKVNVPQFAPEGLNFGYYYLGSPIIAYDNGQPPAYTMGSVTPSTVPGCRMPHFWLAPGQSVYDRLGPVYTLIRFDARVNIDPLIDAAAVAGMPLVVLDTLAPEGDPAFEHALLIVRQDQHVAWRGDVVPANPTRLVDRLCGRRPVAGNPSQRIAAAGEAA